MVNINSREGKKIKIPISLIMLIAILIFLVVLIIPKANKEELESEPIIVREDGTKVNNSNKLKKNKKIDGMILRDIDIREKDNVTTLTAIIENTSKETKGDYPVTIKIKDKDSNIIKEIAGYVNSVEAKETTILRVKTSYDFANAYDFEIEKAEENATNE